MIAYLPQDGVRFVKNVSVPVGDGTRLALDLHVPDVPDWEQTPQPLILEYIPYRKDDSPPYSGQHEYFARHGFIGARLDCRGTGSSEGVSTDEYTEREQQDAVEAIAWLADQPWCDGNIAMTGGSYGGFTSVQIAAHQPPNLRTVIPIYFTDDRYTDDCHYRGGAWRCYYDIGSYGAMMIGMNAMPPYPEYSGGDWARIWEEHLENNTPYLLEWLAHQTDGPYWRPGSIRGRYGNIRCPVFMIGGWRDGYPNPPLRCFDELQVPKKLLMGPWNHARPNVAIPGPRIDHLREIVRWCDHWLKGEENGVTAEKICCYVQGYDEPRADRTETSGYWRVEEELAPPGSKDLALPLAGDGVLGGGSATEAGAGLDEYEYRPTVGIAGGLWSGGVPYGLPSDQRIDEIHSVNYTGPALTEPLEIIGRPTAVLHVSSTAPVMAFVARLCDVAPDGTSSLVCTGVLNGTRRDSLEEPEPMHPGEIYELEIELDGTAWRFEPRHRLRLSICSADFPNLWPTPYRGTNRVHRGPEFPSHLLLPVVPTRPAAGSSHLPADETTFAPAGPASVYSLSPHDPAWQITHDQLGDRTGLKTVTRDRMRVSPETEVQNDRLLEVWASNRDPANVSAVGQHLRRIERHDGVTRVDACCTLSSTAGTFHLTIDLQVTINGLSHFQRRWVRDFARNLL